MKEKEKKNKKICFLIILSLVTFVIATISTTFAFFTAYIKGNEDAEKIQLETADIIIAYEGNDISVDKALPGWTDEITLTIKNITRAKNVTASYSLNWEIETNEINDDALVYTVNCESKKDGNIVPESTTNKTVNTEMEMKVPSASSSIGNSIISSGTTHICKIKMKFKETGQNQNNLQNKNFKGKVILKGQTNTTENEG